MLQKRQNDQKTLSKYLVLPWTNEEKAQLINLYKKYGKDLQMIAQNFPHRTLASCTSMATRLKLTKGRHQGKQFYTKEQDELLLDLYRLYPENWKQIIVNFKNRSQTSLKQRYRNLNKINASIKIDRDWKQQQDQLLMELIETLNYDWNQISTQFENCNGITCYSRYKWLLQHYLSKKKNQQDNKLMDLFEIFDGKWEDIATEMGNKDNSHIYQQRFNKLKVINLHRQWSLQQFNKLIDEYQKQNGNWSEIHKQFPKHTIRECYFKYYHHYLLQKQLNNQSNQQLTKKIKYLNKKQLNKCQNRQEISQNKYRRWTQIEDKKLLICAQSNNLKWGTVIKAFQNRTRQELIKRYQILKSEKKENKKGSINSENYICIESDNQPFQY